MRLAARELVADLHDTHGAFLAADQILALLGGLVGIHCFQLVSRDEEDVVRKDLFNVIVADRHVLLSLSEDAVDAAYDILKRVHIALISGDDLLPVPLVDVDGVDVVRHFVAADRHHVGVEPFTDAEAVFAEGVSLPFGERVDDFRHLACLLDIK